MLLIIHFALLFAFALTAVSDAKPGSSKAVGPCILGKCPRGFRCEDAECVPDVSQIEELGPCVNNLCPKTYQCNDNICIRPIQISAKVRADADPVGPCVNDKCPDNHICVASDYKCYPIE